MEYRQPRYMHIPESMARGIRRCHNESCERIERGSGKPSPLANITMKTKTPTRWHRGVCSICGEWCEMITHEHAHRHGFKDADEMAREGVVK